MKERPGSAPLINPWIVDSEMKVLVWMEDRLVCRIRRGKDKYRFFFAVP